MAHPKLKLAVLPGTFVICRFPASDSVPDWALSGRFFSITRTSEELSVVCRQVDVPEGTKCEKGWRCLGVKGPLDFSLTGVVASLTIPLAQAGISVFVISTYDTDYLMVKEDDLKRAIQALSDAGHQIEA